jgi:hypothetical protein
LIPDGRIDFQGLENQGFPEPGLKLAYAGNIHFKKLGG